MTEFDDYISELDQLRQEIINLREEVGQAYKDGYNLGMVIGAAKYKHERRDKLIEVGYYLCLRRLGDSINTKKG